MGLPALNAARAGIGLPPLTTVFEQFRRMDRVLVLTDESFDFAIIAAAVRGALPDPVLRRNARHQADRIRAGIAADRAVAELGALARHQGVSK